MSFQTGKATSAISWQWQPTIYQRKATNVWCVPRVTGFYSHQQTVNQIIIFYVKSVQVANIRASLYTKNPSKLVSRVSFELHLFMHFKPLCRWTLTFQHPQIRRVSLRLLLPSLTFDFCWAPWVRATVANQFRNPAITSWYGRFPIICKVSYMSGGAGLLPSIVSRWMMNLRSTVSDYHLYHISPTSDAKKSALAPPSKKTGAVWNIEWVHLNALPERWILCYSDVYCQKTNKWMIEWITALSK